MVRTVEELVTFGAIGLLFAAIVILISFM